MKLQLKTIVAAVALIGAAGSASAAMSLNDAVTGSSLVFFAFDEGTNTSYTQDLGLVYSNFLPGSAAAHTNAVYSVGGNTKWSDYLASVGGDTSSTTWSVVAGLTGTMGNGNSTDFGILSTIRNGDSAAGQAMGFARSAVGTPIRSVLISINNVAPNITSGYFTGSSGADNMAGTFGHNAAGKLVYNVDNYIGDTSAFQYGNSSVAGFPVTTYAGTFSFDGNNLNYAVAAVPEPSSYAMMLGGLMLVGGIAARRRNSSK